MVNEFDKNVRSYPKRASTVVDFRVKNNIITIPIPVEKKKLIAAVKDGWESIDKNDKNEGFVIYPREEDENDRPNTNTKIHSISTRDGYTNDVDDCNDWGGLIDRDIIGAKTSGSPRSDAEPAKQEKTAEFYYNLFQEDKEPYNWLLPGVIAGGGHPLYSMLKDDLDYLRDAGFKAVVSAFELPIETKHLIGMEYMFIPTLDGYSSHLLEACEFIARMEDEGKPVFVHCFAGRGRTGTVLAAYLLYKNYLSGADEAIAYIREKYSKLAIETSYQEDELHRFAARL